MPPVRVEMPRNTSAQLRLKSLARSQMKLLIAMNEHDGILAIARNRQGLDRRLGAEYKKYDRNTVYISRFFPGRAIYVMLFDTSNRDSKGRPLKGMQALTRKWILEEAVKRGIKL
jgi:hypothetical protein